MVLGINPHAGDNGLLGDEEQKKVVPAIERAQKKGVNVFGPYPADSALTVYKNNNFDVILSMYHDQFLPVIKAISNIGLVNLTLGIPIIRTSVGHGTAFNIAGDGIADVSSFKNAIDLAIKLLLM